MIHTLETAVRDPLTDILIALLAPLGDVWIQHQEPLPLEAPPHHLAVVLNPIVLGGGLVVVRRDGAARDDAPERVHVRDGHVEEVAAHVVVVDVDAVGGQAGDGLVEVFFLVVEP